VTSESTSHRPEHMRSLTHANFYHGVGHRLVTDSKKINLGLENNVTAH